MGGSRQHHGQASSVGVAASAPVNPSFLNPGAMSSNEGFQLGVGSKDTLDDSDVNTARPPNFAFPRLAAPKAELDDNTARTPIARRGHHSPHGSANAPSRRSPSPFREAKPPSTPPSAAKSRGIRIPPDINIPPSGAHIPSPLPSGVAVATPVDASSGMPSISVDRQALALRGEEEGPRPASRARKGASPMNFQFPPPSRSATPARDRDTAGPSAPIPTRPRTPSGKEPPIRLGREPQEGLTPPKALNFHHPASRSMDSPRTAGHVTSSSGLGKPLGSSHGLGRSQTAGVFGSQSDSEAFGTHVDGTRLAPARPLQLKRQASMETGLSLGRNMGLRDGLHTSSNSTASASTSISSATSVSMGYGPLIQPLNYAALLTGDDVQTELARVVEDLRTWLTVVETGLNGVLEATSVPLPSLQDGIFAEDGMEGDSLAADESYEVEGHDYEEGVMQEGLSTV
ncbi:hypothetical protein FRC00_014224 [Tulasnella sp. 408]|nr:hypothetical protein FRC00_014224 [Tulasnella sp. 408]